MLHALFILIPFFLITCSGDKPAPTAPASKPLGIELRFGGTFSPIEQRWMLEVSEHLSILLADLPAVMVSDIPDMGPFHLVRLSMEGVVVIKSVRVYVEPLEMHHFKDRVKSQDDRQIIGFGHQAYIRSVDDERTAIGVVLIHQERAGLEEALFKRNFMHQFGHALGVGMDPSCHDLSLSLNAIEELGYGVHRQANQAILEYLNSPFSEDVACLSPSLNDLEAP